MKHAIATMVSLAAVSSWSAEPARAAALSQLCDAERLSGVAASASPPSRADAALAWARRTLGKEPIVIALVDTRISRSQGSASLRKAARDVGVENCPLAKLLAAGAGYSLGKAEVSSWCGQAAPGSPGSPVQLRIEAVERAVKTKLSPDAGREALDVASLKPDLQAPTLRAIAEGAGLTACPLADLYDERAAAGKGSPREATQRLCDAERHSGVSAGEPPAQRCKAALEWAWANLPGPVHDMVSSVGQVPASQQGLLVRRFAKEQGLPSCAIADLLDLCATPAAK